MWQHIGVEESMRDAVGAHESSEAKQRIVAAAIDVIATEGFGGATARAIARSAGCNQALIYYYFGNIKQLYLAALGESCRRRMDFYRAKIGEIHSLEDLARVGESLWLDDIRSSHMTVAAEMVSAALQHPDLGREVVAQMEPWVAIAEEAISRAIEGTLVAKLVSTHDLAQALVALFLGMELMYHLDHDAGLSKRLFAMFSRVSKIASPLLSSPLLRVGN
jgi:AcrR family transcriptional regulator